MSIRPVGKMSKLACDHPLTTEGKNQSLTSTRLIISRVIKLTSRAGHFQFLRNSFPIRVSDSFRKRRSLFSSSKCAPLPSLHFSQILHVPQRKDLIWGCVPLGGGSKKLQSTCPNRTGITHTDISSIVPAAKCCFLFLSR